MQTPRAPTEGAPQREEEEGLGGQTSWKKTGKKPPVPRS